MQYQLLMVFMLHAYSTAEMCIKEKKERVKKKNNNNKNTKKRSNSFNSVQFMHEFAIKKGRKRPCKITDMLKIEYKNQYKSSFVLARLYVKYCVMVLEKKNVCQVEKKIRRNDVSFPLT